MTVLGSESPTTLSTTLSPVGEWASGLRTVMVRDHTMEGTRAHASVHVSCITAYEVRLDETTGEFVVVVVAI